MEGGGQTCVGWAGLGWARRETRPPFASDLREVRLGD